MKKSVLTIVLLLVAAGVLILSGRETKTISNETLSKLVGKAILQDNVDGFAEGECSAEGHKILGSRISNDKLKVYALTMYGNYGFQNDMFIKVSGTGAIPAVITFEKEEDGYEVLDIKYPEDGAGYTKSIKRLFPIKYWQSVLSFSDTTYSELTFQERKYASDYLVSIGRDAIIGEYVNLNVVLLTDLGISVDVSNKLLEDERLTNYPYWVGTIETLESDVRCVKSLEYDEDKSLIVFKTIEKDSGNTIECYLFNSKTGKEEPKLFY